MQKFTVRWKDSALYRDVVTAGYVYLDGIKCGGRFIRKSIESQVNTVERSSAGTSMITERPYVFSPIEFTGIYCSWICKDRSKLLRIQEDDPSLHQRASLHALGEISVVVWRVEIGETRFNPNTSFPDDEKINERSKKGLKHCIKWASTRACVIYTINFNAEAGIDSGKRFKQSSRKSVHARTLTRNP